MKNDFIPASMGDMDTWEVNFKTKVSAIAAQLNIDAAEVSTAIAQLDVHRASFAAVVAKRNEAKAATSTNNGNLKVATQAIRELCNRIKSAKGYTEAMGNELKIICTATMLDRISVKPTLTASKEGSGIVIKFVKDKTDGVHIYCKRGSEADFSFLAVDTASPYHDNRPNLVAGQAENRAYKAWYFMDESMIGQESDVLTVTM